MFNHSQIRCICNWLTFGHFWYDDEFSKKMFTKRFLSSENLIFNCLESRTFSCAHSIAEIYIHIFGCKSIQQTSPFIFFILTIQPLQDSQTNAKITWDHCCSVMRQQNFVNYSYSCAWLLALGSFLNYTVIKWRLQSSGKNTECHRIHIVWMRFNVGHQTIRANNIYGSLRVNIVRLLALLLFFALFRCN